jgi:hypothetical protein
VTYTVDWQKDRVSWAMDGVPLLTKWASSAAEAKKQDTVKAAGRRTLLRCGPLASSACLNVPD